MDSPQPPTSMDSQHSTPDQTINGNGNGHSNGHPPQLPKPSSSSHASPNSVHFPSTLPHLRDGGGGTPEPPHLPSTLSTRAPSALRRSVTPSDVGFGESEAQEGSGDDDPRVIGSKTIVLAGDEDDSRDEDEFAVVRDLGKDPVISGLTSSNITTSSPSSSEAGPSRPLGFGSSPATSSNGHFTHFTLNGAPIRQQQQNKDNTNHSTSLIPEPRIGSISSAAGQRLRAIMDEDQGEPTNGLGRKRAQSLQGPRNGKEIARTGSGGLSIPATRRRASTIGKSSYDSLTPGGQSQSHSHSHSASSPKLLRRDASHTSSLYKTGESSKGMSRSSTARELSGSGRRRKHREKRKSRTVKDLDGDEDLTERDVRKDRRKGKHRAEDGFDNLGFEQGFINGGMGSGSTEPLASLLSSVDISNAMRLISQQTLLPHSTPAVSHSHSSSGISPSGSLRSMSPPRSASHKLYEAKAPPALTASSPKQAQGPAFNSNGNSNGDSHHPAPQSSEHRRQRSQSSVSRKSIGGHIPFTHPIRESSSEDDDDDRPQPMHEEWQRRERHVSDASSMSVSVDLPELAAVESLPSETSQPNSMATTANKEKEKEKDRHSKLGRLLSLKRKKSNEKIGKDEPSPKVNAEIAKRELEKAQDRVQAALAQMPLHPQAEASAYHVRSHFQAHYNLIFRSINTPTDRSGNAYKRYNPLRVIRWKKEVAAEELRKQNWEAGNDFQSASRRGSLPGQSPRMNGGLAESPQSLQSFPIHGGSPRTRPLASSMALSRAISNSSRRRRGEHPVLTEWMVTPAETTAYQDCRGAVDRFLPTLASVPHSLGRDKAVEGHKTMELVMNGMRHNRHGSLPGASIARSQGGHSVGSSGKFSRSGESFSLSDNNRSGVFDMERDNHSASFQDSTMWEDDSGEIRAETHSQQNSHRLPLRKHLLRRNSLSEGKRRKSRRVSGWDGEEQELHGAEALVNAFRSPFDRIRRHVGGQTDDETAPSASEGVASPMGSDTDREVYSRGAGSRNGRGESLSQGIRRRYHSVGGDLLAGQGEEAAIQRSSSLADMHSSRFDSRSKSPLNGPASPALTEKMEKTEQEVCKQLEPLDEEYEARERFLQETRKQLESRVEDSNIVIDAFQVFNGRLASAVTAVSNASGFTPDLPPMPTDLLPARPMIGMDRRTPSAAEVEGEMDDVLAPLRMDEPQSQTRNGRSRSNTRRRLSTSFVMSPFATEFPPPRKLFEGHDGTQTQVNSISRLEQATSKLAEMFQSVAERAIKLTAEVEETQQEVTRLSSEVASVHRPAVHGYVNIKQKSAQLKDLHLPREMSVAHWSYSLLRYVVSVVLAVVAVTLYIKRAVMFVLRPVICVVAYIAAALKYLLGPIWRSGIARTLFLLMVWTGALLIAGVVHLGR